MALCPHHGTQHSHGLRADVNGSTGVTGHGGAEKEIGYVVKTPDIKCQCHAGSEGVRRERETHAGHQKLETTRGENTPAHWCQLTLASSRQSFKPTFTFSKLKLAVIMVAFGATALFLTLRVLLSATPSSAAPVAQANAPATGAASGYWLPELASKGQGKAAFNANPDTYLVYRNVKDFGATGDGSTDDTAAINKAIASLTKGSSDSEVRCGEGCDSTTITPAVVYFPPGTYMISKPIIQYYYTQFIGDAKQLPTLKATAAFEGMGLIDADPYIEGGNGANWFTNQNNFYRSIRNFIIDISAAKAAAGVHWQVSQATSIQNVVFNMADASTPEGQAQKGIFQDNGSGGFMTDLVFNGGAIGAFLGSQQFTTRNMTFNKCGTGIYMNWNWLWTMKSNTFNGCKVGLDMANAPDNQTVGSVLLLDSKYISTPVGVNTSFSETSIPIGGGTLIIDNVDFSGTETAVQDFQGKKLLAGGSVVKTWAQGNALASGGTQGRVQGDVQNGPTKPQSLLGNDGGLFERSKPLYADVAAGQFVSLKTAGAKGDGKTDDTKAVQAAIDGLTDGQVLWIDHGAYILSDTIVIPAEKNVKIVGETYPLLMATGANFEDMENPKPLFQVGKQTGDKGAFEMSDSIITTKGPTPGAILMEWNINAENGAAGLWDVHFRIGGFQGTELQSDTCSKQNGTAHDANPKCIGSFMQLHITKKSSGYFENVWLWTADHELDLKDHNQIDIYNGRGMLVESQGPVWLYGTASEHSVLSQYHFQGAKNIYLGAIQTETPYYQPNPNALQPFKKNDKYFDPDMNTKSDKTAWAVRIIESDNIWVYGAGTYSFFQDYSQDCVATNDCQEHMNEIDAKSTNINVFGLSSKASVNMITQDGKGLALDSDNRSNFCATLGIFAQA
ncbi:hypothetical protein PMIN06_001279 [Paraphaeosphaeria minitans]